LSPTDSGLSAAQQERRFLQTLCTQYAVSDVSPAFVTLPNVMDLLEAGGYDWLHVAAHGNFYAESPNADSAIWLQDRRPLTPNAFVGRAVEQPIRERRPSFIFNACHSGRAGWELNYLGGWTNRLLTLGAGMFLAPLWTVNDGAAFDFAQVLYTTLLRGEPIAEAVRQARWAIRRDGDPTWLAYSVYAHPNARVSLDGTG